MGFSWCENIRHDPGAFLERGVFGERSDETHMVRIEGLNQGPGTYADHLFTSKVQAEKFANDLASPSEDAIRNAFGLPHFWPDGTT